jgi:hypothetical protein
MASDLKILIHRNSDNLHLKLAGHFDADAAQELFTFIKAYGDGACSIFIHTGSINRIHPTGPDIFRSALYGLNNHFFGKLIFTGKDAVTIAPKNSQII